VGARFSARGQTGSEAHPALYNGYRVFPGERRPGRGVDHPTLSSAEVKERVELYPYSPSWISWPVLGWNLPLPLPLPITSNFKVEDLWKSFCSTGIQQGLVRTFLGSSDAHTALRDSLTK